MMNAMVTRVYEEGKEFENEETHRAFVWGYVDREIHGQLSYDRQLFHRKDGPAVIEKDTGNTAWFIDGERFTFHDWCVRTDKTDAEKMILQIKYGVQDEYEWETLNI